MKLAAGSLKFLLLDNNAVSRNLQRSLGTTQPVAIVIEVGEDGTPVRHFGTNVEVLGNVTLSYSQHTPLATLGHESIRAAYTTTAEVVIDEVADEAAVVVTTPKPAKPSKPARVTTVATEENKPNGE